MEISIVSKKNNHVITFKEITKTIIKIEKFSSNTRAIEHFSLSPLQVFDVFSALNTRLFFDDSKTITLYNKDFVCLERDSVRILIGTYNSKSFVYLLHDISTGSATQIDTPKNILNNVMGLLSTAKITKHCILLLLVTLLVQLSCFKIGTQFVIAGIILCVPFYAICISRNLKEIIKILSKKYIIITHTAERNYINEMKLIYKDFMENKDKANVSIL